MTDKTITGIVTWLKNWFPLKSELGTVATSNNYNDLDNKPNIPSGVVVDTAMSSTSTNAVQNKVIQSALNGKANSSHTHAKSEITDFPTSMTPTSHASTATTYGLGTTSNYGHVKTINGLTQSSHSNGTALSAYQGKVLNDKIDGKADTSHNHTTSEITDFPTSMTPSSHTHGNITNDGKVGTAANKPLITTTNGVVTTGSFGTAANTFCQGNDTRLSNSRTPTSHASTATTYGVSSASNYGHAMASSTSPKANGTAAVGSETAKFARGDHVHPHNCVNNLTSTSTTAPLAANQGKVLKDSLAWTQVAQPVTGITLYANDYLCMCVINYTSASVVIDTGKLDENASAFPSAYRPPQRVAVPNTYGSDAQSYSVDVFVDTDGFVKTRSVRAWSSINVKAVLMWGRI